MQGQVAVFSLTDSVVTNQDIVSHPLLHCQEVRQVAATENNQLVFTCLHPGCVIYQWSVQTKTIVNKLDCSKLIPCSESLVTINIDDGFSPGRCQVSSVSVSAGLVYIGTCWGCMVVAEAGSLAPITIFRPYNAEIQSLVSFSPTQTRHCMVSLGRGYRNLIERYCVTRSEEACLEEEGNKMYALLWRTDSWLME